MGNQSSQIGASQATEDTIHVSQPSSQIPALEDGEQQSRKRQAASPEMGPQRVVKKAKKTRSKDKDGLRAKRRSVPQHMRGFAIQPSQEMPDSQNEERTLGGAIEANVDAAGAAEEQSVGSHDVAGSEDQGFHVDSAGEDVQARPRKKHIRWQKNVQEGDVDESAEMSEAQAEIHGKEGNPAQSPAQPEKKRKQRRSELATLQKDVEYVAPAVTSSSNHASKRQKRDQGNKSSNVPEDGVESVPNAESTHQLEASFDQNVRDSALEEIDTAMEGPSAAVKSKLKPKRSKREKPTNEPAPDDDEATSTSGRHSKDPEVALVEDAQQSTVEGAEVTATRESSAEAPPAYRIPTPPESPEEIADQNESHAEGVIDATEREGSTALPSGEEMPADAEDGRGHVSPDVLAETSTKQRNQDSKLARLERKTARRLQRKEEKEPHNEEDQQSERNDVTSHQSAGSKKKTRRSRNKQPDEDNEDEDAFVPDPAIDESDEEPATVVKNSSRKHGVSYRDQERKLADLREQAGVEEISRLGERGQVQGAWSSTEKALADEIFQHVLNDTGVDAGDLKANIIDWAHPSEALKQFKIEMLEAFPKRPTKSITRFCQRRFNSFDRGAWTVEQDQLLREAYKLTPDQWTLISDYVGRFADDCRDRWVNVVKQGGKMVTGPWSKEEEDLLTKAVHECRKVVLKETKDEELRKDPEMVDAMISWKAVATKFGGTRSVKRCREKWMQIRRRTVSDTSTVQAPQKKNARASARDQKAREEYDRCGSGDIYDMITEICEAVPDPTKVFDHESTFWSIVGLKCRDSKFKTVLKRVALYAATEVYDCKAVRKAETLAGKAKAVKERIENMERKGKLEFDWNYEGNASAKRRSKRTAKKRKADEAADEQDIEDDVVASQEVDTQKPPISKRTKLDADQASDEEAAEGSVKPSTRTAKKNARAGSTSAALSESATARPTAGKAAKANAKPSKTPSTTKRRIKSAMMVVDSDDEDAGVTAQVATSPSGWNAINHRKDEVKRAQEPAEEVDSDGEDVTARDIVDVNDGDQSSAEDVNMEDEDEDVSMNDVDDDDNDADDIRSLASMTPELSASAFMERCRQDGGKQKKAKGGRKKKA